MKNLWLFNQRRIEILQKLMTCKSASGCDIKDCLKVKKALLSYHLGVLKDKRIIEEKRSGREKYYRIRPQSLPLVKNIVKLVD